MAYESRVYQWLLDHSNRRPGAPAIGGTDRVLDYASLRLGVDALAERLRGLGVRPGEPVVVVADALPECVVALLAVPAVGGVVVPIHPRTPPHRAALVVRDCDARALLRSASDGGAEAHVSAGLEVVDVGAGLDMALRRRTSAAPPVGECPGAILYTSGTTGEPRGAVFREAALAWTAQSVAATLSSRPEDVIVSALPLAFTYGFSQILISLCAGSCLVLSPSRALEAQLALVRKRRASGFPLVPSMLASMAKHPRDWYSFPSVRYVTTSGSRLTSTLREHARGFFPRAAVFSMYGTTECGRVAMLPPDELDRRPRSVGRPLDGLETRLVDDEGDAVRPGEVGELLVRGPGVMDGYLAGVDRRGHAGVERAEWVRTGDLFRTDADGYLEFTARLRTMIKSGGFRIASGEVEAALASHPDVLEAAVVGVPDDALGEAVAAFVVLRDGVSGGAWLRRHCARFLEPFKVPRDVHCVEAIPKNANGKSDIEALTLRGRP